MERMASVPTKKILEARYIPKVGYRYRVHLDTSKVNADGEPEEEFVAEWTWGEDPPPGTTPAQYKATIDARMKGLAQAEAESRGLGTPLQSEGEEF